MGSKTPATDFDVIVIGSGMGGMTTAAALSRVGRKVLMLEQAQEIGGLTHSFSRHGFTWDVGIHYCGSFGHEQYAGRLLDKLSDGAIEFSSVGPIYDTLHFPGGVDIPVKSPGDAYKAELKRHFPDNAGEIDGYFEALLAGEETMQMVAAERAMPEPFLSAHQWWNKKKIHRWCGRTTGEVVGELISNPELAAVLTCQWGTYGGNPKEASFGFHGMVLGHYLGGAGYPVGGASAIARGLVPVIEGAGGRALAGTAVTEIILEDGSAVGVRTAAGDVFRAPVIVSAIGAGETVKRLLPEEIQADDWAAEIATFKPSICHFDLFLGFEGDIAAHGATGSNHWFYESWDATDAVWSANEDDPLPMMFVSFGALKDKAHDPGPDKKYSGDMLVWADWASVAPFANGGAEQNPEQWQAFKQRVEARMLAAFKAKFPDLAPLITYHELGTPLATAAFTGHEKGGFYGVETTPRRVLSDALRARTPVPGLFLSGQDVVGPGIAGAFYGGMMGAAAVDPRVFRLMR
ncbi:MAG: NAD(P)/FAD-dependent oxidoreductase [Alcanivoracaceae bacterium]|nr:NAD(P)/FAD-dependent oxidoreductase [Alcanivoracaceae bacterium]